MNRVIRGVGLSIGVLAASGCVSLFYPLDDIVRPLTQPASGDDSAEEALFEGIVSDGDDPSVYTVVHVHGISCHEPGYSSYFQYRMAERLGLDIDDDALRDSLEVYQWDPKEDAWTRSVIDDFAYDIRRRASVRRGRIDHAQRNRTRFGPHLERGRFDDLRHCPSSQEMGVRSGAELEGARPSIAVRRFSGDADDAGRRSELAYVEVTWSPLSQTAKNTRLTYDKSLREEDGDKPFFWFHRALINGVAKETILNDKISDAVYYLGPGGDEIRAFVRGAVCVAALANLEPARPGAKDTLDPCARYASIEGVEVSAAEPHMRPQSVFISESVGSRVLFDTIVNTDNVLNRELAWLDLTALDADCLEVTALNEQTCHRHGYDSSLSFLFEMSPKFFMFANQLPLLDLALDENERSLRPRTAPELRQQNGSPFDQAYFAQLVDAFRETLPQSARPALGSFTQCPIQDVSAMEGALEALAGDIAAFAADMDRAPVDALDERLIDWIDEITALSGRLDDALPFQPCLDYEEDVRRSYRNLARNRPEEAAFPPWLQLSFSQTRSWAADYAVPAGASWHWFSNARRLRRATSYLEEAYEEAAAAGAEDPQEAQRILSSGRDRAVEALRASYIELVAFSDRNDVLSYEFPAGYEQRFGGAIELVNVPIRLKRPLVPVHGRFGVYADAAGVHQNHKYSEDIMNLILCGAVEGQNFGDAIRKCSERE